MLKIEVAVPEEHVLNNRASEYLSRTMAALGFVRIGVSAEAGMSPDAEVLAEPGPDTAAMLAAAPVADAPKRERGKPAPGRARRTKEEIAEDEAAERAEVSSGEAKANISTGDERVDPADVAAQDAADEAAEVEEHRDPVKPLTVDDVKAVVGQYVTRYGMPAVQEDGVKIFAEALGAPPAGEAYWKMSILPDDQAKLARVIDIWQRAVAENPLKREVVGG